MTDVDAAAPTSRAALGMGAVALASRATGFVRVLIVAAVLGTSYLGNSFQAADVLTNVLFDLLAAGALSAVLVPAFVRLLEAGDQRAAEEVAGGVLGVALLGLGALTIVGELAAPLITRGLTVGVPASVAAQERDLIRFLLRFVLPQVMLYAAGAVAIAVLHARRRFAVTVAAPMGSTVVMVACLLVFSASVTGVPGFALSTTQRLLLAAASTGGVVGFVGILLVALESSGFRLRPRRPRGDERVRELLRHSGWGIVLHSAAGLIMGAALVLGSRVAGAVVAYQVAWAFFLAPYAILAQPIHTAVLPELVVEGADLARFRDTVRWAIEHMALFVVPVAAGMVALALPGMRLVSFGEVEGHGPGLLAASLAALAVGLLPYGVFLLLARAYYALGDSRTPGMVSLAVGAIGVVAMAVGASRTHGAALAAVIGGAHTLAYAVGCLVLLRGLGARTGGPIAPRGLVRIAALSGLVGMGAWLASRPLLHHDPSRLKDLAMVAGLGGAGTGAVLLGYRVLRLPASLTTRLPVETRTADAVA